MSNGLYGFLAVILYALFGIVTACAGMTVRDWQYWTALGILMAVHLLAFLKGMAGES